MVGLGGLTGEREKERKRSVEVQKHSLAQEARRRPGTGIAACGSQKACVFGVGGENELQRVTTPHLVGGKRNNKKKYVKKKGRKKRERRGKKKMTEKGKAESDFDLFSP